MTPFIMLDILTLENICLENIAKGAPNFISEEGSYGLHQTLPFLLYIRFCVNIKSYLFKMLEKY